MTSSEQNILSVDTSHGIYSVAISHNDSIHEIQWENIHQHSIHHKVEELLHSAQLSIDQIDLIAVNIGPGRFTGIRVGVAFAKGLATALKIPTYPVRSLDCIAYHVTNTETFCALMDARMEECYMAHYTVRDGQPKPLTEISLIKNNEIDAIALQKYGTLEHTNCTPLFPSAEKIAVIAKKLILSNTSPSEPKPLYIRKAIS